MARVRFSAVPQKVFTTDKISRVSFLIKELTPIPAKNKHSKAYEKLIAMFPVKNTITT